MKASIALHQVYGVDLNATAVELAEISLWLDTMVSGLQAPWFGLHLKRGNSLIGARRAVYTRAQVNDKSWLKATPADVPMTGLADDLRARHAELALAELREARHQEVADDQIEHRVAEELEPLVVVELVAGVLVAPARVAQRLIDQRAIREVVAEDGFERGVVHWSLF